ncbi:hypothetical protein DPSP01_002142 [Paraphaeosphaeria sporulosa]
MFPKFRSIENKVPMTRQWDPPSRESRWLKLKFAPIIFGWTYAIGSIALLVLTVIGPYKNADGSERVVKGWFYPAVSFGTLLMSLIYYLIFIASTEASLVRAAGIQIRECRHGENDRERIRRRCDVCQDSPQAHRHARDGYEHYFEVVVPDTHDRGSFLYWFFGGTEERHHPRASEQVNMVRAVFAQAKAHLKEMFRKPSGLSRNGGANGDT